MDTEQELKVAAAQYPLDDLTRWRDYERKIGQWVAEAAREGAHLLVFPEYALFEVASLDRNGSAASIAAQFAAVQGYVDAVTELFARMARRHGVYILAGTLPYRMPNGSYRNRALFFAPSGSYDVQDKLVATPFEAEDCEMEEGDTLKLFATEFAHLGINICYDSEFPLLAQKQVDAGATLLLVPSCTGNEAGYNRVRISCQARAVENQCYVVQASTVGDASWSPAIGKTVGRSAVYTPADRGFPEDGVLASGLMSQPQWVYATLRRDAIERVRDCGEVANFEDHETQRLFQYSLVGMAQIEA